VSDDSSEAADEGVTDDVHSAKIKEWVPTSMMMLTSKMKDDIKGDLNDLIQI
jgi:hypothetical protein